MKRYILSLDEGTTSARAVLFSQNGEAVSCGQVEFRQIYPQPGFVEHNPEEIFAAQQTAVKEALSRAGATPRDIAAVGITNQRETVVVWDRHTGKPVYNAIVWQCRRTAELCEQIKTEGFEDYIHRTTGLKIDAYFSATKIQWILNSIPGARKRAEQGELLCGTMDTWLIWKFSGGKIHVTDRTNASRTMLYDIHRLCWDETLLDRFAIPKSILPEVKSSSECYGDLFFDGIAVPVCGIAGDQQAALFGQKCFLPGQMKNTYGTGCFLLMNTGVKPFDSQNGLLTTIAASANPSAVQYALEGSVFVGGAVIQWLRDEIKLIDHAAQSEQAAFSVPDNGGVYIVPAFTGLGAPYWNMYAKGTICGLTRGTNRAHLIRAALEAIAYQTNDVLCAMQSDTGLSLASLKADGGAAANSFLLQFQADISGIHVIRCGNTEATAAGAAYLAGIACGFWDMEEIQRFGGQQTEFIPSLSEESGKILLDGWKRAVKSAEAFCS